MLLIFRYAVKQKTFVRLYMFYITVDRFSKLVNRCQQYLSLICKHFWLQNKHFHETKAPSLLETIFLKSKKKKDKSNYNTNNNKNANKSVQSFTNNNNKKSHPYRIPSQVTTLSVANFSNNKYKRTNRRNSGTLN